MSEDRFNGLLLLYVRRGIKLDYQKIIDMYAMRYPRGMVLKNQLTERWLMKKFNFVLRAFEVSEILAIR